MCKVVWETGNELYVNSSRRDKPCVLLITSIDKTRFAFVKMFESAAQNFVITEIRTQNTFNK